MQYVDRTEDVKAGDLIVTGGLDNIFPKGFPLGVVTDVERKTKTASLIIHIKPVVESSKIEDVFVVKDASHEDFFEKSPDKSATESATPNKGATTAPQPKNSKKGPHE